MLQNTLDLYYKLTLVDTFTDQLMNQATTRQDWFSSNGFDILKIDKSFFKDSKLFPVIELVNATPLIFKMNPMTWYDWHTDSTRQCAINLLLTGYNSHCFFGDRESRDLVHLTELTYSPNTYYLLNTQTKHAVLNLTETRYLLSIGVNSPFSYREILKTCVDYNL
jgi:hypothetical protein